MNTSQAAPRSRRRLIIGGVVLGAALVVLQAVASIGSPTIVIRGVPADSETFSLSGLQSREDRSFVAAARHRAYEACLRAKGFSEPPGESASSSYVRAYGMAAFGDDASSNEPLPAQRIEIADGVFASLRVSWTPQSCMYRSFAQFGVDPLVREGLRQQMTLLLVKADRASAVGLEEVVSRWAACLQSDGVDPQDLLNAIDGLDPNRSPYAAAASSCLTDDIRAEAMRIRAQEHIRVAAENEQVVQAWAALIDTELGEARAAAE